MTALRTWGFVLALSLCGCGARTDDSVLSGHEQPAMGTPQAQRVPHTATPPSNPAPQVTQTSAPTGFIKPSSGPAPSGCCPPVAEQETAANPAPPSEPAPSEPPRPDAGVAPPPASNACFEYLGDWITCENAGWPNVEQTSARDLQSCMQFCQQRPDCTAVTDYFWLGRPDLGCWLYTSTCNAPAGGVWQEEDGGRQYRKQCAMP